MEVLTRSSNALRFDRYIREVFTVTVFPKHFLPATGSMGKNACFNFAESPFSGKK
jgi:hypothetical protein